MTMAGEFRLKSTRRQKNPLWKRELTDEFTPINDQVIEIGVNLLSAGYALKVNDESIMNRIILNDYQPSPKRTISSINDGYGKQFQMLWSLQDEDIKEAVAQIPKVKMFHNGAYVPYLQFESVLRITDQFIFKFHIGVDELIAKAKGIVEKK